MHARHHLHNENAHLQDYHQLLTLGSASHDN